MCVVNKDMQIWHEVVERWCGPTPTYGLHKHTAAVHCSKFPPNPPHGHASHREKEKREATCQCVAILVPPQFIFHSTLTQRQRHICFSFRFVLPSSNFLSFTSYFTPALTRVR